VAQTDSTATIGQRNIDALFGAVYARLKGMAGRRLAAGARGTLDTTALVHELYLRLNSADPPGFEHPAQFFAYAARAMRHLLSDRARNRMRLRAGGDWVRVTLTDGEAPLALESAAQVLDLERALQLLEATDERAARVVELRYFAGLTLEQVADTLALNRSTIDRDWRYARAFLRSELG